MGGFFDPFRWIWSWLSSAEAPITTGVPIYLTANYQPETELTAIEDRVFYLTGNNQ